MILLILSPLLFQAPRIPWWASVVTLIVGASAGLMGALPWRSVAEARKDALEIEQDKCKRLETDRVESERQHKTTVEQLQAEKLELEKQNALLTARTDLDGLRAEVTKQMVEMAKEFKRHSEQDQMVATQQTEALKAVQGMLQVVHDQLKK